MQRIKILILILILCILSPCYGEELYNAIFVKFSDADSMWIWNEEMGKIKIIIAGIDAPEAFRSRKLRMDSKRCKISQKRIRVLGRRAIIYARSILKRGEEIKIKIYKKERNRIYGSIYLSDGGLYAERIVGAGYACVSGNLIDQKEMEKLKKALIEAKKEQKGLWKKYYKIMDCLCR